MKHIYEIVDTTCDEMYFFMGVFFSLKQVKLAMNNLIKDDCAITESGINGDEDFETIQVRQYPIGMGDNYKVVMKYERNKVIDEELDEYKWVTEETEYARVT